MKPQISMIALAVEDLSRSQRFYEDGPDLPRMDGPPNVVFFNLNGTWLGLSERADFAHNAGV